MNMIVLKTISPVAGWSGNLFALSFSQTVAVARAPLACGMLGYIASTSAENAEVGEGSEGGDTETGREDMSRRNIFVSRR